MRVINFCCIIFTITIISGCSLKTTDKSFDVSFNSPMSTVTFTKSADLNEAAILNVYYADTTEEKTLGLGNVDMLKENEGMLFSYQNELTQPIFWMKQVEYPIDIIWVADNKIIGLVENVQPELSATPLADYKLYQAPANVDWVIETSAGYAKAYNLSEGDNFAYSLPE